ncbi:hypothetical protein [Bacillus massilinigeriensis]|uniref:hypothetical protein n=1 Tax=Bacillus massilionigeriensis TaxID=1805475 RepID=UPI00096B3334|nr:hypothetical protein [Bacillus massilionigeriensis]
MAKNPRLLGDEHVKLVYAALTRLINKENIDYFPNTVIQTAFFIESLYPNIKSVTSKFETPHPDHAKDLTLYLENNKTINVNLFSIRKGRKIQPKNPGAKSFFSKYFLSEKLQETFNNLFEKNYLEFLRELLETKIGTHYINDKKELKKLIVHYFPKFTQEINPLRDKFLYSLRESCFTLLRDFYNEKSPGFFNAFNVLFMTDDLNIVTSYGNTEEEVSVEKFDPGTPEFNDIRLYKSGKNTVGIKFGEVALTLRFKFESGPNSSIKLAVSYDSFPNESQIELINQRTIQDIIDLINSQYIQEKDDSNAIGKCHESFTYFYLLKEFPSTSQVDEHECVTQLSKYYSQVKPETLEKLYHSTSTIVPVIREKLTERYNSFSVENIELVPDSYIEDKLDTGDLQLILRVSNNYIVEKISLKAIRKNSNITTKNPGIGTILGPTYFNIGDLNPVVKEIKSKFIIGQLTHRESLEIISEKLGDSLENAPQKNLKQGIENLLGKALMAITIYDESVSYCKKHTAIDGKITVKTKTPTAIQNTLAWNNDSEQINLRVKFSKGQKHGWSSIKLTSEYRFRPD